MSAPAGSRLLAVGTYRPRRQVSNEALNADGSISPAWIERRVGISSRHLAGPDETVVSMATAAARRALDAGGLDPAGVDLVLLASCTMPTPIPNGAASVAAGLGIGAAALDLNAACSGFCAGLAVADAMIRAGTSRRVLLVGAERFTGWVDPDDVTTSIIFADGAGAAVLGPSAEPGVGPVVWGSDGGRADLIRVPDRSGHLELDGHPVYRWAITEIAPVAREACRRAGIAPADLAAFVPHQANLRIVDALADQLGIDHAVVAHDLVTAGNTSAASVPLALAALSVEGRLAPGDPVLLAGFGAGLTWAAQVIRAPAAAADHRPAVSGPRRTASLA